MLDRLIGYRKDWLWPDLAAGLTSAAVVIPKAMAYATVAGLPIEVGLDTAFVPVVIVYSVDLIHPLEFRTILAIRRTEFVWALTAFAGVMLLGTLRGILVAIPVSLVSLAQQAAEPQVVELARKRGTNVFRPRSSRHPDDETFSGLLIVRVVGRLFFANYQRVFDRIRARLEEGPPRVVAPDLSGVIDVEYTALKMLTEAESRTRERGIDLWLVGLTPEVLAVVNRSPFGRTLGRERMFHNLELAVATYLGTSTGPRPGVSASTASG